MKKIRFLSTVLFFILILGHTVMSPARETDIPTYFVDYTQSSQIKISAEIPSDVTQDFIILRTQEDLEQLQKMCKTAKTPLTIIDHLSEDWQQDLSNTLALIDFFYDEVLRNTSCIDTIIQVPELINSHSKLTHKYTTLQSQPLGRYIKANSTTLLTQPLYTIITPLKLATGQYIEYKVNEKHVTYSSRYPHKLTLDESLLHPGVNQVKTIVHFADGTYKTKMNYINSKTNATYASRSPRAHTLGKKASSQPRSVPVLMYHKFLDQVSADQQSIAVSTTLFEKQLKTLLDAGYTPVDFNDLNNYLVHQQPLPAKPFIITSDDGYLCNYTNAYPLLKKYQAKATFFVSPFYMGDTSVYDHFTWDQALEMEQSGLVDIQSHTYTHVAMNTLNETEVGYQIAASFNEIEKQLGKRDIKVLAYPEFRHSKQTQKWTQMLGIDLQITNLVKKKGYTLAPIDIKRIHVSNETSPETLLKELNKSLK